MAEIGGSVPLRARRRGKKHDEGVRGANGTNDKNIYIWKSLRRGVRR